MDLLDFDGQDLYFDEPMEHGVAAFLDRASKLYPDPEAEWHLLEARQLAPRNLSVFVALYRYYYYQHRVADALNVAEDALAVTAARLNINGDWRGLGADDLAGIGGSSLTLLRFHLLALKGSGYLLLRLGRHDDALARLDKVRDLDAADRLGAGALAETVRASLNEAAE